MPSKQKSKAWQLLEQAIYDDQFKPAAAISAAPTCLSLPPGDFERQLSALCEQISQGSVPTSDVAPVFHGQHGVSRDHSDAQVDVQQDSAEPDPFAPSADAALELLDAFEEKDDFPECSFYEYEPSQLDLELLRSTVQSEHKRWDAATSSEKAAGHFERTAMQVLLDRERNRRGCARGACCVYSMWYDSTFKSCHGNCNHQCTISHGALARCGPSLFALDLPPLDYPGDFRRDPSGVVTRTPPVAPAVRRKYRRMRPQSHKKGDSSPQAALPFDASCDNNSHAIVAKNHPSPPQRRTKRDGLIVSAIQRVRKRMGQRTFGKVQKRPKVVYELPGIVGSINQGLSLYASPVLV